MITLYTFPSFVSKHKLLRSDVIDEQESEI